MSLAAELDEIWAAEVIFVPEDKRVITDAAYKKLVDFGVLNGMIKVVDSLPPCALPNAFDETTESSKHLAAGQVVLTVFRDGFNVNALNPGLRADMGDSTALQGVEVTLEPLG